MKVVRTINEVQEEVKKAKLKNKTVGFVPTMGALHNGHLSLIKQAKKECKYVVVSIFVNPTQFGPNEDYKRYPRNLNKDISLLKKEKIDLLFVPSVKEMYSKNHLTWVNVENLSEKLEGKFRPNHFKGVCTVVIKLFNIVRPDKAYFGWKDAQQLIIIKKMVDDLNIPVEIVGLPTIREKDGLAASSRNVYLSEEERKIAISLYKSLQEMEKMVKLDKIKNSEIVIKRGKEILKKYPVKVEYLQAVNIENLEKTSEIKKGVMIAGAIKIRKVRLIDNIIF